MSVNTILEAALQYAGRGWRVIPLYGLHPGGSPTATLCCTCKLGTRCPSPGKHPAIKAGKAFEHASSDAAQLAKWFKRRDRNLGIATGGGLAVVDIDGQEGLRTLRGLVSTLPQTLVATTGRGAHLYFSVDGPAPTNSGSGLDVRGDGGMVVAPPSAHVSGRAYAWQGAAPLAAIPAELLTFFRSRRGESRTNLNQSISSQSVPAYLRGLASARVRLADRATAGLDSSPSLADLEAVARTIPNDNVGWDEWNRLGMAFYRASEGSDDGLEAFCQWSEKSRKYDEQTCLSRWEAYDRSPPDRIGFGTLRREAELADPTFVLPSDLAAKTIASRAAPNDVNGVPNDVFADLKLDKNTLISLKDLNNKHCVINDVGGKCLVMSWSRSRLDPAVKIPLFQTFKTFCERYSNRYIETEHTDAHGAVSKKREQLGAYWLKWVKRVTYEELDLDPAHTTPEVFNLWRGFAVEPRAGAWPLLKAHIHDVLANGDDVAAWYIVRWAAWAVQHPGERAEVALVLKGGKGVGKGTFANAMRRLFGAHGLQIYSSRHLVGTFNAHLRNCLLLFADEAFWAGDKPGESVLKGLLTEPALPIEQKGVDMVMWPNRLHVIMSANADWVVPASHDERRYAVFDVNGQRTGDKAYFRALYAEIDNGGLGAMLHDLQRLPLGDWHPRDVHQTQALQEQKMLSLNGLNEWWFGVLQNNIVPFVNEKKECQAQILYEQAKREVPAMARVSMTAFGRFLKNIGADGLHRENGKFWKLPELNMARKRWEEKYGKWQWEQK